MVCFLGFYLFVFTTLTSHGLPAPLKIQMACQNESFAPKLSVFISFSGFFWLFVHFFSFFVFVFTTLTSHKLRSPLVAQTTRQNVLFGPKVSAFLLLVHFFSFLVHFFHLFVFILMTITSHDLRTPFLAQTTRQNAFFGPKVYFFSFLIILLTFLFVFFRFLMALTSHDSSSSLMAQTTRQNMSFGPEVSVLLGFSGFFFVFLFVFLVFFCSFLGRLPHPTCLHL